MIKGALNFRIFVGIPSYTAEFLVCRDFIITSISKSVALFQLILGNVLLKLYAFFWVIPRHLNFICRHLFEYLTVSRVF
jgi:hypothetical protein